MYKLVAFDFDGTLADSADWFFETMDELAGPFGFKRVPPEERASFRALDTKQTMKRLGIPVWKLPRIAARLRERAAAAHDQFPLFSPVPELFQRLQALGISVAVVSSNSEETIRRKLGSVCASQVVHFGCGASLFGKARKLNSLLRKTQTAAAEAVYVGDEIRDAVAAREAKMAFGAVTWGYASREALATQAPDFIFESFDHLVRQLAILTRSPRASA